MSEDKRQGIQGHPGVQGIEGSEGPEGPTGPAGPKGREGIEGPVGAEGVEGPEGIEGPEGVEGPKGVKGAIGPEGPRGAKGEGEAIHPYRWRALTVWIVAFTLIGAYSLRQNDQRVEDIQQARVSSCVTTYEGIRKVFKPFFPKEGDVVTPEQATNVKTFNDTIDRLKRGCAKQTKVG